MTAKVEAACYSKRCRCLYIDESERACINCIWYEQYYHKNRGNVAAWVPTSKGYCLLKDTARGALRKACHEFEKENRERRQGKK